MWMIFGLDFLTPKSRVKNEISLEQACLFLLRLPLSPLHWFCRCLSWYVQVLFSTFSFKDYRQSSRGSKTGETEQKNGYIEYGLYVPPSWDILNCLHSPSLSSFSIHTWCKALHLAVPEDTDEFIYLINTYWASILDLTPILQRSFMHNELNVREEREA